MAAKHDDYDASAEAGLVVGHFGVEVEVRFDDGERRRVRVKRHSGLVVGDRVRVARGQHPVRRDVARGQREVATRCHISGHL